MSGHSPAQTILFTGATGFLGSRVVPLLLAGGHRVIALSRRPLALDHPRLRVVPADFSADFEEELVPWAEIDAVAHLAASGVKSARRVWAEALQVNVVGTQRLLDAVRRRAAKRPLFLAARTFYEHLTERSPALLDNPYIATKAAAAELVKSWAREYDGPVALATVFQLFGPGDAPENVLSYASRQFESGEQALFGSGRGLRDWLYVDDAAAAVVALLTARPSEGGEWDIGSGELTSIREMVERLAALAGRDAASLTFDAARDRSDTDLALRASRPPVGWTPRYSLTEALSNLLSKS